MISVVVKPIFDEEGLNLIWSYSLHSFAETKHFDRMKDK